MKHAFILFLLLGVDASAYNPPFSMIMSRTAENHGHGGFVIEQDVTVQDREAGTTQTVHETWTVIDENRLRLNFQGSGPMKDLIAGSFVYEGQHRTGNESGGTHKRRLGDDWLEPFFHFRYSKNIKSRMVQLKMAPAESLRERPAPKSDKPPEVEPESYVTLTRQNGMVAWGVARSFDSPDTPEAWIEQDEFVITKLRTPDKSVVEASDYEKFDNGFYLPRTRVYEWDGKSVTAMVRSVRALGTAKSKEIWNKNQLTPVRMSGSDLLKEFYLRFR